MFKKSFKSIYGGKYKDASYCLFNFKRKFLLLTIVFVFGITFHLNAQISCGFDQLKNAQAKTGFPWIDALEDELQAMITNIEDNNIEVDVVIPIIVHVIHESDEPSGSDANITQSRVEKAKNDLNIDFANTGIQFCLAKRYPDGTPLEEEGLVRVEIDDVVFPDYNLDGMPMGGQIEFDIKNLGPQFSNYNYLNIWTVKDIYGLNSGGEIRGFASFPLRTDPSIDGVTMDVDYFGIIDNRTLTHEVGHYVSLYHSFEGDDSDYDGVPDQCPNEYGDYVDDTDPHQRSASGSCPSGNNECTGNDLQNIVHNHMNYSGEICRDYFSPGQMTRMQASVLAFRPGLIDPLGCVEGCEVSETVDFSVDPTNPVASDNPLDEVPGYFVASSDVFESYEWYIDGEQIMDNDGIESDLLYQFIESGKYIVCMRILEDGCKIEVCKEVVVYEAGLCQIPITDPCELLRNGDFSEVFPEEVIIEYDNYKLVSPTFNTTSNFTYYDKMCNWNNSLGNMRMAQWDSEPDDFFYYFPTTNNKPDGISTSNGVDLVDGVTYEINVDIAVTRLLNTGDIGTLYFSLVDDNFHTNSSENWTNFDYINLPKIKKFTTEELFITDNTHITLKQSDFRTYSFEFTYTSSSPNYLFISRFGIEDFLFFIDNVSVSQCPPTCSPEPDISVNVLDDCTFEFEGLNTGDPGIMYWDIESGPSGLVADNTTFSFALPGKYEVCLNIICNDSEVEQKCIELDVTGCEPNCGGEVAYLSDIMKLCGDEGFRGNVPISVDPGFYPCNEGSLTIVTLGNGAPVTNSSYFFDDTGATPILELSLFFENEPSGGYSLILCGPDGESRCFMFGVQNDITECDDCETVPMVFEADCIDPDNTDNVFVYEGSFSIVPDQNYIPCGNQVSTESGFEIASQSFNAGQWNYEYTITTNNPNSFNTETTICFSDGIETICYTVIINVPKPCEIDSGQCEYQTTSASYGCDKIDGGSNTASFTFRFFVSSELVPEIEEGYSICDNGLSLYDGNFESPPISILTPQEDGYIIAFNFGISCERLSQITGTQLKIEFCNESGEVICLSVDIPLYCSACNHSKGRSSDYLIEDYQVFPNPTNDDINIVVELAIGKHEYQLFDLKGTLVSNDNLSFGTNKLSLIDLQPGVYLLQIKNGTSIFSKKLIKL